MADKIKFLLALLLVVAGIAGFYLLSEHVMVLRVVSVLAGLAAGVAVAWFTAPGQRFFEFGRDAVAETKKVVWPSRRETMQTTAIVFGFVLIMAVMLWFTDKTLEWLIYDLILGWKKS
jgi:preprotein translocase subunit SecE